MENYSNYIEFENKYSNDLFDENDYEVLQKTTDLFEDDFCEVDTYRRINNYDEDNVDWGDWNNI